MKISAVIKPLKCHTKKILADHILDFFFFFFFCGKIRITPEPVSSPSIMNLLYKQYDIFHQIKNKLTKWH